MSVPERVVHLESFFDGLGQVLEIARDTQEQLDRRLATDFSPLRHVRVDERFLSDVLADLLDPAGSHGQRSLFLHGFLRILGARATVGSPKAVRIHREYPLPGRRRIDVLVELLDAGFALAIENKPFAGEQEDQLDAYAAFLEKSLGNEWILVYLPGDGSDPVSLPVERRQALEEQGRFRSLPYLRPAESDAGSLEGWLETCWQQCEAEPVRAFIRSLQRHCRAALSTGDLSVLENGVPELEASKFILANEHNLEVALTVEQSLWRVRSHLITTFLHELEHAVVRKLGDGWHVERWVDRDGSYVTFFRKSWRSETLQVGISAEYLPKCGAFFGVACRKDEPLYDRDALRRAVLAEEVLAPGAKDTWYAAWEKLPAPLDDWHGPPFLTQMLACKGREHPRVVELSERIAEIAEVVAPVFDQGAMS